MSKDDLCYAVVHGLKLDYLNIMDHVLPHRGAALTDFLSGVVEFSNEPGKERLIAVKTLCEDERPFIGHFAGNPVWPAWARFEMPCLAGALFIFCLYNEKDGLPMFEGNQKFRAPGIAKPGNLIFAEITNPKRRGALFAFSARIYTQYCGEETTIFTAKKIVGFLVKKR
jgi:3-hydroxymyristoyl/3-hydroxydecanoyl-(acyl carrier protein) dehydratase